MKKFNLAEKEIVRNTARILLAALYGALCAGMLLASMDANAAPNMAISKGSIACKTLTTLNYAERMLINEPVLQVQKAEVNNSCTTMPQRKLVTAFDIGVTAKVEFFALGKLDVYYVNTRDLVSLSESSASDKAK